MVETHNEAAAPPVPPTASVVKDSLEQQQQQQQEEEAAQDTVLEVHKTKESKAATTAHPQQDSATAAHPQQDPVTAALPQQDPTTGTIHRRKEELGVEETRVAGEEEDEAVRAALQVDRRVVQAGEDGTLPPALTPEAEWDLHEKQEWVERDVQALREMVEAEPKLHSRQDKPFLLSFLRARKFDYDKAMYMMRSYYRAREENADMYVNLVPSALNHVWPLQMQTVLATPDNMGRTVLIFRTGAWLPEVCGLDDVFRSQVVLLEHVVRVPVTQLRGIAAVVDCAGLSMTHAYYLTPTHIRRMISVIQEVFPLRFKALHFVHEPAIFEWIFSLVKPFLSETIKGRLHFHGENLESLHQHIPAQSLPEELGGAGGTMDNSFLVDKLRQEEEYFREHFSYGYEACEEPARAGTVMEAVTDMGSLIGSYYRRMCID